MTTPVLNLQREHRNLGALLRILDRQLQSIGDGNRPDYHLMYEILHYLTYYSDRYHHPYEDRLFTRLAERRPEWAMRVEKLADQHRRIASEGNRLRCRIGEIIDGSVVSRNELLHTGRSYVSEYREHIQVENDLLDVMAAALEEPDWMELLGTCYREIDPVFSDEAGREYRHLRECITAEGAGNWPWQDVAGQSCPACVNP